jgi:hypothetical protein
MRRPTKRSSSRLTADSQRLVNLAQAIARSSSRIEERAWERELDQLLQKLMRHDHQDMLDAALEYLFQSAPAAYDVLMESLEAASEACVIEHGSAKYDALLIAVPILAWTRFSIASGPITTDMSSTFRRHLDAHILAPGARSAIAPFLYAIDQLPRTYAETHALTQRLGQAALDNSKPRAPANAPETAPFLADTRYLLATVVAPAGAPLFRWQIASDFNDSSSVLSQWQSAATPDIAQAIPGCGIELLLPEAYYVACREADKRIRPVTIRAAVHFLTHALDVEPHQLQAIIGKFTHDSNSEQVDEYRVSFTLNQQSDVLYGIVWPLYGNEDANQFSSIEVSEVVPKSLSSSELADRTPIEEIMYVLHEAGVEHIKQLHEYFPMEFCDDCGAPLFPDMQAELTHAEMPEDMPETNPHLH